MKRPLYTFIAILVIGAGYFTYQKVFSTSSLGEKVFNSIEGGKLYYAQTMSGSILLDMDNITTNTVTEHIILASGGTSTADEIINFKSRMFQIPSSIRKHELIGSSIDTASYLKSFNLSEKSYNEIWKPIYSTYQEFIDQQIEQYSKENSFRLDTLNNRIIYRQKPTTETRLKYKVETPTEDYLTELVFVDIDGTKKMAAIFSTRN